MQIQTKCGFSYSLMSESFIIRPLVHKLAGLFRFQFRTAVFTVDGFEIVSVAVAARAFTLFLFLVFAHHCGGNYTCRHGYYGVTYQHYHCGDETANGSNR